MAKNTNMYLAKRKKNDEFYTRLIDIEKECKHYKEQFKGKVIYSRILIKRKDTK